VTSAIDKEKPQRLQLEEQDHGLKTCLSALLTEVNGKRPIIMCVCV